jgi:DNA-binding GntR family transcriptional regulator
VGDSASMSAQSLRQQVYQRLRSAIRNGSLGSSQTATERDLAEQLGTSRTPVREALVLLVHDGLVASTSRGFSLPQPSQRDMADLFEIRRLLEPAALAGTVEHLSAHDLRLLRESLKQQSAADRAADAEAFVAANSRFRATWLAAVPNQQLRIIIERHDDHVQWLRRVTLNDAKVRKIAIAGLSRILDALEAADRTAAANAMRAHLDAAKEAFTAVLERNTPGA